MGAGCAAIFQQINFVPRLDVPTDAMLGRIHRMGVVASTLRLFSDADRHRRMPWHCRDGTAAGRDGLRWPAAARRDFPSAGMVFAMDILSGRLRRRLI